MLILSWIFLELMLGYKKIAGQVEKPTPFNPLL